MALRLFPVGPMLCTSLAAKRSLSTLGRVVVVGVGVGVEDITTLKKAAFGASMKPSARNVDPEQQSYF